MSVRLRSVHEFSLPLAREIVVGEQRLRRRAGLFITLEAEDGARGIGEIAPLPGLHVESGGQCRDALMSSRAILSGIPGCDTDGLALGPLYESIADVADVPPVHFGLVMAAVNLVAAREGTHPARVLSANPLVSLPVNGLIAGDPSTWYAEMRELVDLGYATVKVKVGRRASELESEALNVLLAAFKGKAQLVLDGNRAWRLPQAAAFLARVDTSAIDYAEELLADPNELRVLQDRVGVPMALDETLSEPGRYGELVRDWNSVVVLKPDRLSGSLSACERLAAKASAQGQRVVVSSAFHTPVGLSFLAQVAGALRATHAGLDTLRWFAEGELRAGLRIVDGAMDLRRCRVNGLSAFVPYLKEIWSA